MPDILEMQAEIEYLREALAVSELAREMEGLLNQEQLNNLFARAISAELKVEGWQAENQHYQKLRVAIRMALETLGDGGDCGILNCPGCDWERREAVSILKQSLGLPLDNK